jgi:hypothetical protein
MDANARRQSSMLRNHEAELVVSHLVLNVNEPGRRNADCSEID